MGKRLMCLLILFVLIYPINVYTMPVDGLVAHYSFTGNANDSSGNNLNGTVYGASLAQDRYGTV